MTHAPSLYNLKLLSPGRYAMAKFTADFEVEAVYELEAKGLSYTCTCPANQRMVILKPCKHKRMMPFMLGAVNTDRFYSPDTGQWSQPLGDLTRPESGPTDEPFDGEQSDGAGGIALAAHTAALAALNPDAAIVGEALGSPSVPRSLSPPAVASGPIQQAPAQEATRLPPPAPSSLPSTMRRR